MVLIRATAPCPSLSICRHSYPVDASYTSFYTEFFPAASRGIQFGMTYGF